MTLAKVWAKLLGARNPIWRPAAILKITFSTIWPTVMCDLWHMGYFGPRNWLVMLVSSFDLVLTFKSNMAPGGHLENSIFHTLVPSAVWLMLCGVFGSNEIIYDVILMIRLGLDLFIVHVTHLNLLTLLTHCHHHNNSPLSSPLLSKYSWAMTWWGNGGSV